MLTTFHADEHVLRALRAGAGGDGARRARARDLLDRLIEREREVAVAIGAASRTPRST